MTDPKVNKHPVMEIQKLQTVNFSEMKDDWKVYMKTIHKIHQPGVDVGKDKMREMKAEANQRRADEGTLSTPAGKTQAAQPVQGENFFGNQFDGGIPNDNCLAISKDGIIVSGTNSRIYIFDSTGTQLDWSTLGGFVNGTPGIGPNIKFDPKATYDPVNDRFIFVFLNGSSSNSSKVVVCFSQTNDPTGAWNIYGLDGEVTNGVWTDFPQIGISNDELFITGNLFLDGTNGASGSAVWQIELADGYAGNSLTTQLYDTPYFSLHPVEGGLNMYGPNFYIIRNLSSGSSRDIFLHEITNTIANGGTLGSPTTYQLDVAYSLAPDAPQKGTNRLLQTNDCRIQSSYYENGRIEFVFNTNAGNKCGAYHGTGIIAGPFSSFTGRVISNPTLDVAYPAIAYTGISGFSGENASLIMVNHSSSSDAPGNGCYFVDEAGVVSDYTMCRAGNNAMGSGSQPWRWGDYADIAERHNNPGEAWMAGSFGQGSGGSGTFISQVYAPGTVDREEEIVEPETKLQVFPNPSTDFVQFEFEVPKGSQYSVRVFDVQGREMGLLVEDYFSAGTAMLRFATSHLESGLYFVVVEEENGKVFQEKFLVKH